MNHIKLLHPPFFRESNQSSILSKYPSYYLCSIYLSFPTLNSYGSIEIGPFVQFHGHACNSRPSKSSIPFLMIVMIRYFNELHKIRITLNHTHWNIGGKSEVLRTAYNCRKTSFCFENRAIFW